ncbi:class I histocompatibility antigen, F10 alpha chain-like isoform X1 [Corythoichthys intestinalis]|uniref:class I histocompatibility antigen, F10 alpha chain-like isoform X1 n=1 Tax=Corythoichthys intestinalis TaxID=161448 RepID=UPI0025A544FC|nr:class I histocompatibility antigen, F10 alpha chain-like isoform X1 [Corythoichthys intestinalis]
MLSKAAALLLVVAQIQSVKPVTHTLKYIITTTSQIPNFPEYLSVGYVDGVQIFHYDSKSRKAKPKQDWMNNITAEDPRYWEKETHKSIANEQALKDNIAVAKERFNQTGGIHMVQVMYGCEWDDKTGKVDGWEHYAYDGEDFLSFYLKELRWIAVKPQAVITKQKWDSDERYNQHTKHYYTALCPFYLKKFMYFGKDFKRTELPRISLLQKTSRSPVTCHATGFYPREADLFWTKDGEQLFEDVEMGETLPNHDGTFQTSAYLKVVDADAEYQCVFQLAGVPDDIVTPLDPVHVLSNECIRAGVQTRWRMTITAVTLLTLALLSLVAMKLLKAKYTPASVYEESEPAYPESPTKTISSITPSSGSTSSRSSSSSSNSDSSDTSSTPLIPRKPA